jgi:hypothetical protein
MKSQRGVTLIELIMVVGLMMFITILTFLEKQVDLEQARARIVGGLIFQYNNAVRSALARDLSSITAGTYNGSIWLKSNTCPGTGGSQAPGNELLPCDFPDATAINPIPFGSIVLSTNVVISGTAPNLKFTATTSSSAFKVQDTDGTLRVRADLSGLAVLTAASAMNSGYQSAAGGGLTPYSATTDARYSADAISGKMIFVASNNAYNDTWLRTDGSNQMHAPLQFDSPAPGNRAIIGASSIQNLAGLAIRIGNGSGLSAVTSSGVIVGSSAEVLGDFRIRSNSQVDGYQTVNGNLNVGGSTGIAGNLSVNGSIGANGQVSTSQYMWAGTSVYGQNFIDVNDGNYYIDPNGTSRQNVVMANTSYASVFYDINNSGYYVQPSGTSRLNAVQSNVEYSGIYYDINNTGYYVQPSQTSRMNSVMANVAYASIFYDINNTGYYVQPASSSHLNTLIANGIYNAGRVEIGEFLQLDSISTAGWGCSPNGLVSRDAWGGLLSCTNGLWASPGVSAEAPVTIVSVGPTRTTWSGCWSSPKTALITATGPGATSLVINGVTVGTTMGWGGEFSDIGMDFPISGIVPAGGSYCYYVTNNRAYSYSAGIRVVSSSL